MIRAASLVAVALVMIAAILTAVPPTERGTLATPVQLPPSIAGWVISGAAPGDVLSFAAHVGPRVSATYRNGASTIWVGIDGGGDSSRTRPLSELDDTNLAGALRAVDVIGQGIGPRVRGNAVILQSRMGRTSVLYWYQIGERGTASRHWYRAALLYYRAVRAHTPIGLVQIAAPVPDGADPDAVLSTQIAFARAFHPVYVRSMPGQ